MTKSIRPELHDIEVSGIRTFNNRVTGIPDMIRLTLGEPDFPTPEHIKQAGISAIQENFTNYTPNAGMPELLAAASTYFKEKYDLSYKDNEIIVTVGATEAISVALQTILEPDDEVILPDPIYPGYEPLITLNKARPIKIDTTETNFKLTPEQLRAHITPKTKALIIPYPSNPTGVSLNKEELLALAAVLKETGIFVIADEIYSELTYHQEHISIAPMLRDQTIVINGLSKSHAMIGWRIGFLLAPENLTKEMLKIHQYSVTCASSISQKAALEAITNGKDDAFQMRTEYKTRANFTQERLEKMGFTVIPPDGAFYFFVKLPDEITENSFDWAVRLAEEAKVAVVPGNAFSEKGDRYFRLSYATSFNNLAEALDRMATFLAK
ncbi:aminotransferase class I/II-fold pyridoxal phosphate-dependent enzyme [Listeria welshimeri]|uniref:aminotransferase class I/II-fold pyridoxal phosphate-dependent enzyme n=1 Tax=Listeria welshimeri TaxID=1643 RepID=UPI0010B68913|nr:aminotransferase class I/II-fold pyridoxal phosphate-dependent enzyme [Listeria welshimeri]MBC1761039.1 aminotransferase class I/II-fold pyridoxal phosphate-dependent enzyme [Listeria welshimeri]MBC1954783.1 aminotransferase class I/II-fold pyridoxal phosphate-dependent enzyme [Listeria welshimeri]MBC6126736.1 aminotransferase class I/II-fold pyridoxal phosphate-dependent enzyme [Listeria welshimeri]MBF2702971.1 aminotransferase class I/II-fold pyridoxal phosphate-dependent enzyme [Listeria 